MGLSGTVAPSAAPVARGSRIFHATNSNKTTMPARAKGDSMKIKTDKGTEHATTRGQWIREHLRQRHVERQRAKREEWKSIWESHRRNSQDGVAKSNRPDTRADRKPNSRHGKDAPTAWRKLKKNRGRPQNPTVPRECVELAVEALRAKGELRREQRKTLDKYVLPILNRVLTKPYAPIKVHDFSSPQMASRILHILYKAYVIDCRNWYNGWKKPAPWAPNPSGRRFFPSLKLMHERIFATGYISSSREYFSSKCIQIHTERKSIVIPCPKSGVTLPPIVVSALEKGTGLCLDRATTLAIVEQHRIKTKKYCGSIDSTNREIVPEEWAQNKLGDIWSRRPSIQNLLKVLRPALRSTAELPIHYLDFNSFYPRLAFALCGDLTMASNPNLSCYDVLAERVEEDRDTAKDFFNAFLNGRDHDTIRWMDEQKRRKLERVWPKVEMTIRQDFPLLYDWVVNGNKETVTKRLYRRAATVFLTAYAAGLEITGGRAGIPLHDGWIFAANDHMMKEVQSTWQDIVERLYGVRIPVKSKLLDEGIYPHRIDLICNELHK